MLSRINGSEILKIPFILKGKLKQYTLLKQYEIPDAISNQDNKKPLIIAVFFLRDSLSQKINAFLGFQSVLCVVLHHHQQDSE